MHVVLIHRYFWPDTPPYAHLLRAVALKLGDEGHDVTVLTCQPSYNRGAVRRASAREWLNDRVEVRRWRAYSDRRSAVLKMINLICFCAHLLWTTRSLGRPDAIMAASTPPVAVARVALWCARRTGARFIYHKQDIYPDVALASGSLRRGRVAAWMHRVDVATDRAADRIVVLSADMAETVTSRGVTAERVVEINNFDPWILADKCPDTDYPGPDALASRAADKKPFRVAFAGNLGRFQGLETVLSAAAHLLDSPGIEFHFFGDGVMRCKLEAEIRGNGLSNTYLHGYRPPGTVAEFLCSQADLGLVALKRGVIKAAFPSKFMSYLRHGCPVVALVESDSELAGMLTATGAGVQSEPGDGLALATLLQRVANQPCQLLGARNAAAKLYEESFAAERQLARWAALFGELCEGNNA